MVLDWIDNLKIKSIFKTGAIQKKIKDCNYTFFASIIEAPRDILPIYGQDCHQRVVENRLALMLKFNLINRRLRTIGFGFKILD